MIELDDKKAALIVSSAASFMTPFMSSSVNVALPSIGREFSMDAIALSWVATSYLLTAAIFLIPFGRVADIYGRKRIFLYGIVTYALTSLLCAAATTGSLLIIYRALLGVGGAMVFGTAVALLTSVYPASKRGRVLGINVAAVYLGLSLGPFVGGFLVQQVSWRAVFLINAFLGALIIPLILSRVKSEWAEARGEGFDLWGSLLYSISLTALMYGFSSLPGFSGVVWIAAGVLALGAFVLLESKVRHPVLDIALFRKNTVFAFSNTAALINYSATAAVTFLLSLYLQFVKGLSPEAAGAVLVSQPVMMAVFSPYAGRLSDRIEPRIVASVGMGLIVLGLGIFASFGEETSLSLVVVNLALLGFGFALFSSPNTNAVMSSVEKKSYGIASATLSTMRLTGQMLSMGIVMLIFATMMGRVAITVEYYPEFIRSMRAAFIIFSALCTVGVFASLVRGRLRPVS
jgi:EmrB/QacA subfamily drug resistance transporter